MADAIRHLKVPVSPEHRATCLGPDGSAAKITAALEMIRGRWKLPILFRLYAVPAMRTSTLMRDLPRVSQKMLTQHLRDLMRDGLIDRFDYDVKPPRVEYRLTDMGRRVLLALSDLSALTTP